MTIPTLSALRAADGASRELDADLYERLMAVLLRLYPNHDCRVGMRSGMMDAAALCDALAARIAKEGRPSKSRRETVALLTDIGDRIMAMRDTVTVPRDAALTVRARGEG